MTATIEERASEDRAAFFAGSIADEIRKLAEQRDAGLLTDEEFAAAKKRVLDDRVPSDTSSAVEFRDGARIQVKREPFVYEREAPVSYFQDRVLELQGDNGAAQRLARHGIQMDVEYAARERRAHRGLVDLGLEFRVNPNLTQGTGGYFAPPLWLIDQFKTAARPARVLADLMPWFPLPQAGQSINLPKLTTGNITQTQQPGGSVPGQDAIDANASSQIVTITGEGDCALQLLEQSPPGAHLDWAMFRDLSEAYDANLEAQLIAGSGVGQTLNGLLSVATGSNVVTYTDATPTFPEMYPFVGQAAAQVGKNRKMPPEAWLMTTSRWAWIASSNDNSLRPILPPSSHPVGPTQQELMSWQVYCDDAIPSNLGVGGNQDVIICLRYSGLMLLEAEPRTTVALEPLSGTLQARIQLRNYVAAPLATYSAAVATVGGTGLIVQSGF